MWSDHCHSTFLQTRREYVCSYPPHLEVFGCADEALGCGATLVTLHFYRQEANTSAATSHTWKCLDALMRPSGVVRSHAKACWLTAAARLNMTAAFSKCTLYCVLLCGHTLVFAGIRPSQSARYTVCSCVGTQQCLQGSDHFIVHVILCAPVWAHNSFCRGRTFSKYTLFVILCAPEWAHSKACRG